MINHSRGRGFLKESVGLSLGDEGILGPMFEACERPFDGVMFDGADPFLRPLLAG